MAEICAGMLGGFPPDVYVGGECLCGRAIDAGEGNIVMLALASLVAGAWNPSHDHFAI